MKRLNFGCSVLVGWLLVGQVAGQVTSAAPLKTCAYDPNSGRPNPLGMRAYISLSEDGEGNTAFLFEQFPSPVSSPTSSSVDTGEVPVTIASSRVLTLYGVGIEQARTLMLQNPNYYAELVGYEDPEGFGPVNGTLTCRQGA